MAAKRYKLPNSSAIVVIVEAEPSWPALVHGWVWVHSADRGGGALMAAAKSTLEPVGRDREFRTISGGLTLRHDYVNDWLVDGEKFDVPVIELATRSASIRLTYAEVCEVTASLYAMRGEMPPAPPIPPGSLLS